MSRRPSLVSLEPEVLVSILEFIDDASPHTTRALACVNRYLNQLTRLIAHRRKVIDLQGPIEHGFLSMIDPLLTDETLATIRTLTVKGRIESANRHENLEEDVDSGDGLEDGNEEAAGDLGQQAATELDDEAVWAPLVTLISRIGKLRQFDWNIRHPLPVTVFKVLEQHQRRSTLRIFNFVRKLATAHHPEPIELLLAESPVLTHIRHVTEKHWDWPDLQEVAFRSIISRAPNLQYAGFILLRPFDGWDQDDNVQIANLKSRFYKHAKPNASIRQLTLDGVEISQKSLIDWSSTVDLNSLEMVKFTKGFPTLDYFQTASSMLPNLKHFSLNLRLLKTQPPGSERRAMIAALRTFITSCSPLQTLSLWSWMGLVSLPDLLQRHGPTLQTLQLHERETAHTRTTETLTAKEVKEIRCSCPNLRDFTFDLVRHDAKLRQENDSNEEYYAELARFQNLATLQIYFDLGASYIHWKAARDHSFSHTYLYAVPSLEFDDSDEEADTLEDENSDTTPRADVQATTDALPPLNANAPAPQPQTRQPPPYIRPSRDTDWEAYVKAIWDKVFGHKKHSVGQLDIKVGDWEGILNPMTTNFKRHFVVTPNERDDVDGAVVTTYRGGKSHLKEPH